MSQMPSPATTGSAPVKGVIRVACWAPRFGVNAAHITDSVPPGREDP